MRLYLNDKHNTVELSRTNIRLPLPSNNQIKPSLLYCRFSHIQKDPSSLILQDAYKDDKGNFYDSDYQRIVFSDKEVGGTLEYALDEFKRFYAVPEYSDNGLVPTRIIFDGKIKLGKDVSLPTWDFLNKSVVTGLLVDEYGRFYGKDKKEVKIKAHMHSRTLTIKRKKHLGN